MTIFRAVSTRRRAARRAIGPSKTTASEGAAMALPAKDKAFIDQKMQIYDRDHNGVLDEKELKRLMTDLNDGMAPTEREVRALLLACDADCDGRISIDEMRDAIVHWYLVLEHKSRHRTRTN